MKNPFIALILIILLGFGAYAGYQYLAPETADDAMEQSAVQETNTANPLVTAASQGMIGMWSSIDDRNFHREYRSDGTLLDSYGTASGEILSEATWSLFTSESAVEVGFPLEGNAVYIRQVEDDGTSIFFRLVKVTPEELDMVNMSRGGVLRFGKLTTGYEMQDGVEE